MGDLFYQVYTDQGSSHVSRATEEVRLYSGVFNFIATWVLVVTWDRVPPFPGVGDLETLKVRSCFCDLSDVCCSSFLVIVWLLRFVSMFECFFVLL